MIDEILKYKNEIGKSDTMITVLVYNYDVKELIDHINKCLDKVKSIKDRFKQRIINDRLFNFRTLLESRQTSVPLSSVFFIGKEIFSYNLNQEEIDTLLEYNVRNLYFNYDNCFDVKYIYDLFTDFNFYTVYILNKKVLTIQNVNSTKFKTVEKITISDQNEFDQLFEKADFVCGLSTLIKKYKMDHVLNKRLSHSEILDQIDRLVAKRNHAKLDDFIASINEKSMLNKVVGGRKESRIYTRSSLVKRLFVHENFFDVFMDKQKEFINFEIVEIKRLEHNDSSVDFLNGYGGFIGELYYPIEK